MAAPLIHHRTPPFVEVMAEVREGLCWLYQTEGDVVVMTGSGSTGLEAAVVNFTDPATGLLYVGGGKFAERWGEIARGYGVEAIELPVAWGRAADPEALGALLDAHPAVQTVALTACETSTGVAHPIEALVATVRARRPEALILVDGITAVGVTDLGLDALGADVLVTGSQKVYAVPPGLTMLGVSDRAWERAPRPGLPRYGLDLRRERDLQRKGQTSFSPATSLILGLREALAMLREEGLPALHARHRLNATATRAGLSALGFAPFAEVPCDAVTAVTPPEGLDAAALVRAARALGVILAGGQGALKGRILRVGHLGSHDRRELIEVLATLELAMARLGHPPAFGVGVGAALAVYAAAPAP